MTEHTLYFWRTNVNSERFLDTPKYSIPSSFSSQNAGKSIKNAPRLRNAETTLNAEETGPGKQSMPRLEQNSAELTHLRFGIFTKRAAAVFNPCYCTRENRDQKFVACNRVSGFTVLASPSLIKVFAERVLGWEADIRTARILLNHEELVYCHEKDQRLLVKETNLNSWQHFVSTSIVLVSFYAFPIQRLHRSRSYIHRYISAIQPMVGALVFKIELNRCDCLNFA